MRNIMLLSCAVLMVSVGDNLSDVIEQMKTTKENIQTLIQGNIGHGSFGYPGACRLIPASKRAAVVKAVGEFAKAYTRSEAFRSWYQEYREEHKPTPPEAIKPMAEVRKEQIEQIKKSLAEQEEAYKSASGDTKQVYRQVVETTKQMLQQLEKADPAQDAMMDQYSKQANETAQQEYQQKLSTYDQEFPVDNPQPLLKRRLQSFLEATAGIDYAAKLVKKNKVMVFQNPEYEGKDDAWKKGYRAGKEATEAARAIAQGWLKELEKE